MGNNRGRWMINLGLLLIAAALYLSVYNLDQARQASESAEEVIEQMCQTLPTLPEAAPGEETEEANLPDYVRNPEKEMPVQTVNGQDYIGVLLFDHAHQPLVVLAELAVVQVRQLNRADGRGELRRGEDVVGHLKGVFQAEEGPGGYQNTDFNP